MSRLAVPFHQIEMVADAIDFLGRVLDCSSGPVRGLGRFVRCGLRLGGRLFCVLRRLLSLGGGSFGLLRLLVIVRRASDERDREHKDRQREEKSAHQGHPSAARTPAQYAYQAAARRRPAAAGYKRERRPPSTARRYDRESCPRCPTPRSRQPACPSIHSRTRCQPIRALSDCSCSWATAGRRSSYRRALPCELLTRRFPG